MQPVQVSGLLCPESVRLAALHRDDVAVRQPQAGVLDTI